MWGDCDWHGGDVNISNTQNFNSFSRDKIQGSQGGRWEHRPEHRQGAGYRDQASRDRFGGGQQRPGAETREQFRGRAEQGRQEIARGGVSDRMAGGGRDFGGRASQQPAGGFGGVGGGGAQTRDFSNRGASSRAGSFGGGGGARAGGGGGGARAGGGGGRGGGGRR